MNSSGWERSGGARAFGLCAAFIAASDAKSFAIDASLVCGSPASRIIASARSGYPSNHWTMAPW